VTQGIEQKCALVQYLFLSLFLFNKSSLTMELVDKKKQCYVRKY